MKTLANKINISQIQIVRTLVALVVLFMVAYLYCVNSTAFGAASYERLTNQISQTQSELGHLESVYINKNRSIKEEMGEEFGLVLADQENTIFTERNSATRLTFNE